MKTVRQMWESFARAVIPAGAPEVQHIEMRRAFYAGCWAMLQGSATVALMLGTEDAGADQLQRWEDEMGAFQRDVAEGRA